MRYGVPEVQNKLEDFPICRDNHIEYTIVIYDCYTNPCNNTMRRQTHAGMKQIKYITNDDEGGDKTTALPESFPHLPIFGFTISLSLLSGRKWNFEILRYTATYMTAVIRRLLPEDTSNKKGAHINKIW